MEMTSEELLKIVKVFRGGGVTAHEMSRSHYKVYETYRVWYKGTHVYTQDDVRNVREYDEAEFLDEWEGVPWQVKIETRALLKLLYKRNVQNVEVSLRGLGGSNFTHRIYMEDGVIFDTGIDDETTEYTPEAFEVQYPGIWWRIDQVLTEEGQNV